MDQHTKFYGWGLAALLTLSVGVIGCSEFKSTDLPSRSGDGGGGGPKEDPYLGKSSYQKFQLAVARNCNSCHGADNSPFPTILDFVAITTETAWIQSPNKLVVPGDPLKSAMYNRLTFAKGEVTTNTNMPFAAEALPVTMTAQEAKYIRDYIASLKPIEDPEGKGSSGLSSLAKAKLLLHGGAPTAAEIESVVGVGDALKQTELKNLINLWLTTAEGQARLRDLFELTLDQTDWIYPDAGTIMLGQIQVQGTGEFANQFRNVWEQNIRESFIRTALTSVRKIVQGLGAQVWLLSAV